MRRAICAGITITLFAVVMVAADDHGEGRGRLQRQIDALAARVLALEERQPQFPPPTFDSGWQLAQPGGEPFAVAHPVGAGVENAVIVSQSRSPGLERITSMNTVEADHANVYIQRGLFSPREVRVLIWVP